MKRDAIPGSLLELLFARVTDDRDAPAVYVPAAGRRAGSREPGAGGFSWGDLVASAIRLAGRFEAAGLARGDRLAQIGPHGAGPVVVDIACLLSGIVHVQLHHDDGPASHAEQLGWLEPKAVVLTGPMHATAMPRGGPGAGPHRGSVLDLRGTQLLSSGPLDGLADEVARRIDLCEPEACATILLSSGTSGRPHGVVHSQQSLLANAVASSAVFLDDPRDVRLSWLPLSHALPRTGDLYTAIVRGASLAIVEDRTRLLEACREARPAAILGVPAMFERLEDAVRRGAIRDLPVALGGRVRVCVSGGAPLRERTILAFRAAGVPLVQGYGLAEAGPVVTLASPRTARKETVGSPLSGVEVRVDDAGQLLVRTPARCLGVLQPASHEATAPNGPRPAAEYAAHDPASWLATGDLAEIDPDGHVRITGRCVDAIVLSGGEKVPPAELERAIAEDPLVAQVCVVGNGLRRPLALVVPEPSAVRWAIRRMGLRVFSKRAALSHPKLLAWVARRIEWRQRRLPKACRAGTMLLVGRPFDAAHGEATVSLKLKRQAIANHFRFAIDAVASGEGCRGMTTIPPDTVERADSGPCIASTLWSPSASPGFAEAAAAVAAPLRPRVARMLDEAAAALEDLKADGTIFERSGPMAGKFSREAERALGGIGLWGMTVSETHGGMGASVVDLARGVSHMAAVSPTAAGMLSVHASIGAVSAVQAFGTPAQQDRWLPRLASGEPISIFAATEPDAGCDLGRVAATLERSADRPGTLLLSGTKMFITAATYGRLVKLLAKLDGRPAVVLARLPEHDTTSFRLTPSSIHPLKHAHNATLVFDRFEVDEADLLTSPGGDGMAIIWHGLNRGRVTLAAQAAGTQRIVLGHAIAHARSRETWGRPIATRQLVHGRLARIAMGIVASESLATWSAFAVDSGGGELEAITAKIVAGECVRESAMAALGVHAGRSFLVGNPLGDAIHDHLAVGIYEGESELLGLALFKGLAKRHPLAESVRRSDARRAAEWLAWRVSRLMAPAPAFGSLLDASLRGHAAAARRLLDRAAAGIDGAIRRHGRQLAEEQLLVAELSRRVRELVAVLAVAHHVDRNPLGEHDPSGEQRWRPLAADALCRTTLARAAGRRPSSPELAAEARLGAAIVG